MFLYKLKKLIKEKKSEVLLGPIHIAFIASFVSQFFILFISSHEFSRSEKKQMFLVSLILTLINLFTINYISNHFDYSIILCIFVGVVINFFMYIIPAFILIIILEWSDVHLTKDEIRDVKLNKILRKLF